MRKYTRKLMAAAMCAAMTASMIPASTWAGENTDEMSVIRVMGINNTVTTVNGGTVSLKDWIEDGFLFFVNSMNFLYSIETSKGLVFFYFIQIRVPRKQSAL